MAGGYLAQVREKIALACARAGRDPAQVTLVGVTKGRTVEQVAELVQEGVADIGENRTQEALSKFNTLSSAVQVQPRQVRWHMIGHLQTNKVKQAVRIFGLIHSVDSLRLAKEISVQACALDKVQEVLLEIKTSAEATKYGIPPEQAQGVLEEVQALPCIKVNGFMTIAALGGSAEDARPYFRRLRQMLERINAGRAPQDALRVLSMGMSDDFEVAIEEGATMVRVGRALFG